MAAPGTARKHLKIWSTHSKRSGADQFSWAGMWLLGEIVWVLKQCAQFTQPTLTVNPQTFRTTRSGAVSYFAGGDPAYPKDTGFALKDWVKCEATDAAE
ncbi:hypothetical protein [Limnohabitans sp. 2KL-51]|uniref:hypothetical protein n=1 Tax=Limnohabitans sp. 2KL-51 TaxID=1977911 RepID=UPI0018EEB72C